MKKLILVFIFAFFLFQIMDADSLDFSCNVRTSCGSNEKEIFYMYSNSDSHVSTANKNWPYKLCCTELRNQCSGLYKEVFKLYLSDGHVSTNVSTINQQYQNSVCLSVYGAVAGQGNIACNLKSSCSAGEQCIVTLSSNDDAHVSSCDINPYPNKLCCGVTVCPARFIWNPGANQGKGGCTAAFQACYIGDPAKSTSDEVCKDKWRFPVKQSDLYWRDATDSNNLDCFRTLNDVNAQSCCPLTPNSVVDNKEYGSFENIIVKKTNL